MVKIPLTSEQIIRLLEWRDGNKELVRAAVIPFPECSILSENGMKIRAKQDEALDSVYHITVTDTKAHEVKGRFTYATQTGYVWMGSPKLSHDDTQTAITIWGTVSAYVVNFQPEVIEKDQETQTAHPRTRRAAANKPADRVVYLKPIVYSSSQESPVKRKYTPCENAFSVRGHYRHYKSGKVVYVQPYEKNTGKEKDKRNKVLKIGEV